MNQCCAFLVCQYHLSLLLKQILGPFSYFVTAQAQDNFRESGGLNFVLNLLTTCRDESVIESAMYALGCATEKNGKKLL